MINNYVDNIYCINLDKRTDRWEECQSEFKKLNIQNSVNRFSAVDMSPGIAGCTRSHYEVIKLAKEKQFKNVLILEDDVVFNTDIFTYILNNTFDQLKSKNLKYDMLYLGANLTGNGNKLIDKNLAKLSTAKTTHAYIVNSSIYDYIIDSYYNIDWNYEYNWSHENPNRMNIDVFYVKKIQKMGNTYGTYPSIADQREGYSDIIKLNSNYKLSTTYNKILENSLDL